MGQESKEVGVTAARERALVKAEKVLGKGYRMLNSVANLALNGLEVCKQELGPDEAKTKLKPILEQLSGLVADTSGSSDITAMFAQPELVKALQKVYKGESDQLLPLTWSNMIALTNDMRAEVDRRRAVLDELITVQIGPFPPIERIWTVEAQDKTALREMNAPTHAHEQRAAVSDHDRRMIEPCSDSLSPAGSPSIRPSSRMSTFDWISDPSAGRS